MNSLSYRSLVNFVVFTSIITLSIACKKPKTDEPVDEIKTPLFARYSFDDNVKEEKDAAKDGTIFGTPTFQAGVIGKAIELNNVNASFDTYVKDYVELPAMNVGYDFSISQWVYFRSNASNVYECFSFSSGIMKREKMFGHAIGTASVSNNGTPMKWENTPTPFRNEFTGNPFSKNKWVHVVITVSKNSTSYYIDGELVAQSNTDKVEYNFVGKSFVGAHQWDEGSFKSSRFNGLIDDLRIYKGQLTADEVKILFKMR
jgi:hypothetical protein